MLKLRRRLRRQLSNTILIRTWMTQMQQRQNSRKLQMHTRYCLMKNREEFMIRLDTKDWKIISKVEAVVEVIWIWMIFSHNSLEVVEEEVGEVVGSISILIKEAEVVVDNKDSSLKRLKIFLRIQMLLLLIWVLYSNSIDAKKFGSYISLIQNFKSAKTSRKVTLKSPRSSTGWSK